MISLDDNQRRELADMVDSGRLRAISPDPQRAASFLAHAGDGLEAAGLISSAHVSFDVAYNAAHDAGEALMAALGVRPGRGEGAHATVGAVLVIAATGTPFADAARAFDALRQTRNRVRYDAGHVGEAQATHAHDVAAQLLSFASLTVATASDSPSSGGLA